jgi:Cu/Ag efflux protein CusF
MFQKKTLLLFLVLTALCVGLATAQYSSSPAKSEGMKVTGTIEKIDQENKKITLKDAVTNEKKDYSFTETTTFNDKENKPITATDLKKGLKVRLMLDADNNVTAVNMEPSEEKQ